jgi:hypothetical protein
MFLKDTKGVYNLDAAVAVTPDAHGNAVLQTAGAHTVVTATAYETVADLMMPPKAQPVAQPEANA